MQSKSPRVLIVDDTVKNIQILGSILKEEGYRVNVATSGEEALKILKTVVPNLILLDVMMPGMDGFETCEHIRKQKAFEHVPIIFLTAKTDEKDIVRGFELGAVDYITKPFKRLELLSRTHTHITIHQQSAQLEANLIKLKELRKKEAEYNQYVQQENARLETKVHERTMELRTAYEKLEKANKELLRLSEAKNNFIKMIAHELRTPLHGMAAVEILFMDDALDEEERDQLQEIYRTSYKKLLEIVEHSIALTELKAGVNKQRDKHLLLTDLIEKGIEECSEFGDSRKIEVYPKIQDDTNVTGNRDELIKAIKCMVIAGIKFSDGSAPVDVVCRRKSDVAEITIKSTGYALPDRFKEIIFDPMAVSETLFPGGDLGLGPALAKHIISSHRGKIYAGSGMEKEVIITIELPVG